MYLVEIYRGLIGPFFESVETKEDLDTFVSACRKHLLNVRTIYKKNVRGHFIRKSFNYNPAEEKVTLYK